MSTIRYGAILSRPLQPKHFVLFALLYLGLQTICIVLFPAHAMGVSYPFMILAPWLALAVCWRIGRAHAVRTRLLWTLLSAALAIWAVGMLFAAWEDLSQHTAMTGADFSDFLFFVYGMPVLLAISSPTEGERISLFVWLDALQVLMTAFLAYVAIFSVLPFAPRDGNSLSVPRLLVVVSQEVVVIEG